jgi:HEPN domain-containing protein
MKNKTAGWVFFAKKDIALAETIIDNPEFTGEIAFHCQQAIEKYFKAYLAEHEKPVAKIHNLLKLYAEVKSIKDWNLEENLLDEISKIYTESRYPEDIGIKPDGLLPSKEEAKSYLVFAQKIEAIFNSLVK